MYLCLQKKVYLCIDNYCEMRHITSIFVLVATLLLGCQTENIFDNGLENGETVLSVTLTQTRTSLGEKQGETYPAYWCAGDRIVVNGVESAEAAIDANNAANATFAFNKKLSYPYYITYPYTASTTAETPAVVFPAEQSYAEGTFASGSAPMCGYIESGNNATLSHLAAILRFSVKAKSAGVVLKKVVVTATSGAKIAGAFEVDCKNATITPTEDANSVVNHIRAFNPSPVAYTFLNGEPFKVYSAKSVDFSGEVGNVLASDNQLVIGCKSGAVSLLIVQKAGGKAMDIKDFLRGTKLPINSVLK